MQNYFTMSSAVQWSDIDVALVADEFTTNEIKNLKRFSRINVKDAYYRISPHTYNTKHFTPKVDPFVEIILEKGIEIYFGNKK